MESCIKRSMILMSIVILGICSIGESEGFYLKNLLPETQLQEEHIRIPALNQDTFIQNTTHTVDEIHSNVSEMSEESSTQIIVNSVKSIITSVLDDHTTANLRTTNVAEEDNQIDVDSRDNEIPSSEDVSTIIEHNESNDEGVSIVKLPEDSADVVTVLEDTIRSSVKDEIQLVQNESSAIDVIEDIPDPEVRQTLTEDLMAIEYPQGVKIPEDSETVSTTIPLTKQGEINSTTTPFEVTTLPTSSQETTSEHPNSQVQSQTEQATTTSPAEETTIIYTTVDHNLESLDDLNEIKQILTRQMRGFGEELETVNLDQSSDSSDSSLSHSSGISIKDLLESETSEKDENVGAEETSQEVDEFISQDASIEGGFQKEEINMPETTLPKFSPTPRPFIKSTTDAPVSISTEIASSSVPTVQITESPLAEVNDDEVLSGDGNHIVIRRPGVEGEYTLSDGSETLLLTNTDVPLDVDSPSSTATTTVNNRIDKDVRIVTEADSTQSTTVFNHTREEGNITAEISNETTTILNNTNEEEHMTADVSTETTILINHTNEEERITAEDPTGTTTLINHTNEEDRTNADDSIETTILIHHTEEEKLANGEDTKGSTEPSEMSLVPLAKVTNGSTEPSEMPSVPTQDVDFENNFHQDNLIVDEDPLQNSAISYTESFPNETNEPQAEESPYVATEISETTNEHIDYVSNSKNHIKTTSFTSEHLDKDEVAIQLDAEHETTEITHPHTLPAEQDLTNELPTFPQATITSEMHVTEPISQNNLQNFTEQATVSHPENENLHHEGSNDILNDSSDNTIFKHIDEAIPLATPIEEHYTESTSAETSSENPLTQSTEGQTIQTVTTTEKSYGRSSEEETSPALVQTLIEAAELTTEFARHVESFRAFSDEATAISDEIISSAAAGRSFNEIVAEGLGKPLPTRSVGDEPSTSSYSSEDKTTTVVVLCTSAAIIFIAFSIAMYLITFQRQHGTLDIEMQEQECGKDDLEQEDEDAETRVTLLNQLPQADSDTHSFE